jgi:lactoylglutathione lyase
VSSEPCQGIAQVEHIALATGDLVALCEFYRQLGGVDAQPCADPRYGVRCCVLDFCGVRLEVFDRRSCHAEAGEGPLPRLLHLGFALGSADAVDELSRVLAAAGHRVLEPPHRASEPGCYECVVLDPDGNRLKLTV